MAEIEIIDLFAGPGGLGEGFSAFEKDGKKPFNIKISIEKEKYAHETLTLRAFYHQFKKETPKEYYEYLQEKITKDELFKKYPKKAEKAKKIAFNAELGVELHEKIMKHIDKQVEEPKNSIVIGGPPCQAYSLVGRSTMAKNEDFFEDPRHTLYKEYLKIIAEIQPMAFVMENVKGILSSKLNGEYIFKKILEDIENPSEAKNPKKSQSYTVYSLSVDKEPEELKPSDLVIKSEDYSIPQYRHRVILLAVRNDVAITPPILKKAKEKISVADVIADLPKLRSGLSKEEDNYKSWSNAIKARFKDAVISKKLPRGEKLISYKGKTNKLDEWLCDDKLSVVLNHDTRSHMKTDLQRYYFCADFACKNNRSPKLSEFEKDLLPMHKNVKKAIKSNSLFSDRFRVQLKDKPATTIISHISKDGHYFIHYDPKQCRSLTVREAARLQTFPDNYKFEGPRTSQYQQVGNAVPPLLAKQIAEVVYHLSDSKRHCPNS